MLILIKLYGLINMLCNMASEFLTFNESMVLLNGEIDVI